jgi:RND family efflux transporter MFP subunit
MTEATSRKKLAGLAVLVVGALLFMLWLAGLLTWGKIAPGTVARKAGPVHGQVLTVKEESIPQELPVLGAVISKSLAQVSAQVPGRVRRILVEAGSRVKKGDPLVYLSAEEYQARLSQAQAQLTKVRADYQRYRRLLKEGAVSPQEFEAMEARYKTAQAQVREAATLTGYTLVAAPRDGMVAERRTAVGDLAQPGQPLLSLYDPEELQIEGEVNDDYRSYMRLGLPVRLEVPAAGWQGEAALTEIFPISQSASRTFRVRTGLIAEPRLVPGMFARLYLPVGESRGLLIPQAAVRQVGQLTMVEAVVEGRPSLRQVKLGRQIGDRVEVLAGLKIGDQILLP